LKNRLPENHKYVICIHTHSVNCTKEEIFIEEVETPTSLLNNSVTFDLLGIMSGNITDITYFYNPQGADFPDLSVEWK